ncbi:MAG: PfkB domain protein [Bacteroidetes bacterium]|nr:PfkB domain protein [Bacteroidota bacterium]
MKTNNHDHKTVVCYGEVLWDIFPTKTKPGGAPMNVAYHLRKLGIDSHMISRVGADEWGDRIIDLLDGWQIPAHYCVPDTAHETGLVHAIAVTPTEMAYTIEYPAAWDFIEWNKEMADKVAEADAFVYGSLVTRGETSRNTLLRLLKVAKYKVFDINMRPPFYSQELLEELMNECNLLKMNENEVALLGKWYLNEEDKEEACVRYLQDKFSIDEVVVTKGEEGATYYTRNAWHSFPAYHVEVKDTVGSGDSFLAAFLSKKLNGASAVEGMKYAIAVGAFVASNEGACPAYSTEDLNQFIIKKELEINQAIISN